MLQEKGSTRSETIHIALRNRIFPTNLRLTVSIFFSGHHHRRWQSRGVVRLRKESRKRLARVDQEHPKIRLPSWPDLRWRWKRLLQTSRTTSLVCGGHWNTCRTEPVTLNKSGIRTKIFNSCVFFFWLLAHSRDSERRP